mgnify:CR=1 FL=1
MRLPVEKLKQIDYYEVVTAVKVGYSDYRDRIILHFGEYKKTYELFGLTVWTETIPDRTKTFEFHRVETVDSDGKRSFERSEPFQMLYEQLEKWFSAERTEYLLSHLKYHELEYVKDAV